MRLWLSFALLLSLPLAVSCGDDDDKTGGPTCGTKDAPQLFQIADVTPASGSTVEGLSATQSFRIVAAPGLIDKIEFQKTATHTAGDPTPAPFSISVTQDGADLIYTFNEVTWASAGHVELQSPSLYQVDNCVYALPKPLFSYDLTDTGGAAGSAGAGGSGGGTAGAGGSAGD